MAKSSNQPEWFVVATTSGVPEASIIAGRLKSLGIPATIYQEAGGAALGLTIGMGQAKVLVPERYYEMAMATLNPDGWPALDDGDTDE